LLPVDDEFGAVERHRTASSGAVSLRCLLASTSHCLAASTCWTVSGTVA